MVEMDKSGLFKNPKQMTDKELVVSLDALERRKKRIEKQITVIRMTKIFRDIKANRTCQGCGSKNFSKRWEFRSHPSNTKMERLECADCGHVSTYGATEPNWRIG